ncbi:MAG: permease [Bacteroidota bacterium]
MDYKRELKILAWLLGIFVFAYFIPLTNSKVQNAIFEAFRLLQWYARNHTLACVVPALFIAGAIITFLSQDAVLKYLGPKANKPLAYSVASVSGIILAVCSCSVLPMFAGIYKLGAGLGPATAFLYSGPAINIMAIFLTARVLGFEIGLARAIGAIVFAVIVGLLMFAIFRKAEKDRTEGIGFAETENKSTRPVWKTAFLMASMVLFLVFSDWFNPGNVIVYQANGEKFKAIVLHEMQDQVRFQLDADYNDRKKGEKITLLKTDIKKIENVKSWVITIHQIRWYLAGLMGLFVLLMVIFWVPKDEFNLWMNNTWDFTKMLVPLLFGGVFVVGFISELIPEAVVAGYVGDNSLFANFFASIIGAFMYFATLTEIPITEALMKLGMHKGPVMALLLAGPALSLPSILIIGKVLGWKKTFVFITLVVIMATTTGIIFGMI